MTDYRIVIDDDESIINTNTNYVSIYAHDAMGNDVLTRSISIDNGDTYHIISHYPADIYIKHI